MLRLSKKYGGLQFFAAPLYLMTFDEHITKVTYGSIEWNSSGSAQSFVAITDLRYTFEVTMANGYVIDTVTDDTGVITNITNNTFTIQPSYEGANADITITSKLATPRISVDLTTLAGWANLSAGAHNITVVAKADGYRDSEPSTAVSVTKPVATKTLKAGTYKWIDNPNLSGFPSDASYKTYELIFTSGGASFSYLHCSAYNSDWFGVAYEPLPNRTNFVGYSNNRTEWGYFDDDDNFWHKNVAYQTITLATDQEVSVDFYNWAITEGNLVRESAVGTWLLNTTLTRPSTNQTYTLDVNVAYDKTHTFTAKYMELYDSGYSLKYVLRFEHYEPNIGDTEARNFYYTKDHDYNSGSTSGNYSLYVGIGNIFDRVNEAIRTFTITGGADIYNPDLIAWLKANAVKQS